MHNLENITDCEDELISISKDILNISNEDIFDAAREQFMFQEILKAITKIKPEKILFCGGNAHISSSSWYFNRKSLPELHIPTFVSRLKYDLNKSVFSLYFFPYSGIYRYQNNGLLTEKQLDQNIKDPLLSAISRSIDKKSNQFHYTDLQKIPINIEPYKESWNSILTIKKITPDKYVQSQKQQNNH